MIVVRVELHPHGGGPMRELGRMTISNDGTSEKEEIGHYHVRRLRAPDFSTVVRTGFVKNHRRQDETIWSLVGKALKSLGYAP